MATGRRVGLTSGTVGIWRLDQDNNGLLNCAKPGVNDLQNSGTTSVAVTGMPWTNARSFSKAARDYLYLPHHADLNFDDDGKMSFSCWIKPASWDTIGASFLWKLDSTGGYQFYYDSSAENLVVGIKTGGILSTFTYNFLLSLDNWHYIGFSNIEATYSVLRIFADGECSVKSSALVIGNSIDNLYIGRDGDVSTRDFDGLMADIMLNACPFQVWDAKNIYKAIYDPMKPFLVEE